jgi:2-phosphosulfolactate phosphatase
VSESYWRQDEYLLRCEWGAVGAARVGGSAAVVVVDVLSFTTSVSVLVEHGTAVYPCAWRDARANALADEHQAVLAVGRREVTDAVPWSLSPDALRRAPAPPRLVLPSPNGSAIAAAATGVVVAASLRNAATVGRWLRERGYGTDKPLAVVPAGERWPDGSLRPAMEDLLGAGAVLTALDVPNWAWSPEARLARETYTGMTQAAVAEAVRSCGSGRELVADGFADDVEVAVEVDSCLVVPVLNAGCFQDASSSTAPAPDSR